MDGVADAGGTFAPFVGDAFGAASGPAATTATASSCCEAEAAALAPAAGAS